MKYPPLHLKLDTLQGLILSHVGVLKTAVLATALMVYVRPFGN